MLASGTAQAQLRRAAPGHGGHGDRAYNDALQFARSNHLSHFTVNSNGARRIVVNVPSNKIGAWCSTFSKENCYIEPFFNTTPKTSSPSWSMLRVGNRYQQQYGQGSEYRPSTYSSRTAFPVSLSQQEMNTTLAALRNSPNGPWNYNGGDPERTGRNCTNWLTYKVGQFTGVTTASVKHHMSSLVRGYHSPRMSVMAIMSNQAVPNFGQDQLQVNWH